MENKKNHEPVAMCPEGCFARPDEHLIEPTEIVCMHGYVLAPWPAAKEIVEAEDAAAEAREKESFKDLKPGTRIRLREFDNGLEILPEQTAVITRKQPKLHPSRTDTMYTIYLDPEFRDADDPEDDGLCEVSDEQIKEVIS